MFALKKSIIILLAAVFAAPATAGFKSNDIVVGGPLTVEQHSEYVGQVSDTTISTTDMTRAGEGIWAEETTRTCDQYADYNLSYQEGRLVNKSFVGYSHKNCKTRTKRYKTQQEPVYAPH